MRVSAELQRRWTGIEGERRAGESLYWIFGGPRPDWIEQHDGRWDLRGLVCPAPSQVRQLALGSITVDVLAGTTTLRGARWSSLDLSFARLPSLRFFDAKVEDCLLVGADCRDWRLWASHVSNSSFARAGLRSAALGTWHDGQTNAWDDVTFDEADLRDALFLGARLARLSFLRARLAGAQFLHVAMRQVSFGGEVRDVLFDGRDLPGKPQAERLQDVDFSSAQLIDVDFRGCRFDGVALPDGILVVPNFPEVARRALALLASDSSIEARMFSAELANTMKLPGASDSVGVFNRADYVVSGGDALADLVEQTLARAR